MQIDLSGKTALVCGASKGIGAGIAKVFDECGAALILVARDEAGLLSFRADLSVGRHQAIVADLSKTEDVKILTSQLAELQVDIVINNTGGPAPGLITEATPEAFEAALSMHLYASHAIMQTVLPGMKARHFGRFINVISTSVKIPIPGLGVSNTTRGAMASWAKTLAGEVAPFGVTVNNILPGFVETGRLESLIQGTAVKTGKSESEVASEMKSSIPAGRFGQPQELGYLAAFLASDQAAYITGVSIPADGGRTGSL